MFLNLFFNDASDVSKTNNLDLIVGENQGTIAGGDLAGVDASWLTRGGGQAQVEIGQKK